MAEPKQNRTNRSANSIDTNDENHDGRHSPIKKTCREANLNKIRGKKPMLKNQSNKTKYYNVNE